METRPLMRPGTVTRARAAAFWAAIAVSGAASTVASHASAQTPSRRAWLGVELALSSGVVVAKHVVRASPAASAGLFDGDQLLSADGEPLGEPRQLVARVALVGPGGALKLKVRRGGSVRDIAVTLGAFPEGDQLLRMDRVGTFAPEWKPIVPIAGTVPATLASLRGRVVILDFWATWCGPCRLVAPQLSTWQSTYGAQGLTVVGLTGDAAPAAARASEALQMRYAIASDPGEATAAAYGVSALPTLFVIDKRGVIRDVSVGYDPAQQARIGKLIQTLLADPAPAP